MFPLLAYYCPSPMASKLLFWSSACHCGQDGIKMHRKGYIQISVAMCSPQTSVLQLTKNVLTTSFFHPEKADRSHFLI